MQQLQTNRHASEGLLWAANQVSNPIPQEDIDALSREQKVRIKAKYGQSIPKTTFLQSLRNGIKAFFQVISE
jgi:hypothetical protein